MISKLQQTRLQVVTVLACVFLVWLNGERAWAGGPLVVGDDGTPGAWTSPIPYNPDQGPLGALDNAAAVNLVAEAFAVWAAVPTADVAFTNAGSLPEDVNVSNLASFLGICDDTLSPIIFDTDGSITSALFGVGAENTVLGFAGPTCFQEESPLRITEGVAVLNGRFVDGIDTATNPEVTVDEFRAVFIHEFGHYNGLDHSQLNQTQAFDGDATNDDAVPTMFPLLVNGLAQATLHQDDLAAFSTLYPAADFFATTGSISGTVLRANGVSPFTGANVIARNVDNPLLDAISNVSGALAVSQSGIRIAAQEGVFQLNHLTPGANYTVEIEEINPDFTGGSSVGPEDPQFRCLDLRSFGTGRTNRVIRWSMTRLKL